MIDPATQRPETSSKAAFSSQDRTTRRLHNIFHRVLFIQPSNPVIM